MDYAIETIDLVKRYPTSARKAGGSGHYHSYYHRDRINSLSGIVNIIKGTSGPFIEALCNVNLKIKKGETFGIVGPNGAGKTTLIKILCTLVLHDEGEVYVNGFDVQKESVEVLKNLQAVLPGHRGFNWRLTGRQNLEFYALLYGLRNEEASKRIQFLLEFMELDERADDGFQRYSTGMQRKLLLCRALLRDTPILLFDEPTVGLDPHSATTFRRLLHDKLAKEDGKTIFFSTHNLYEAQELCDRIAILDGGQITACDTPNNIRYMMLDEKTFTITFQDTVFNKKQRNMLDALHDITGVYGVTPEINHDRSLQGISLRVDKNIDLSTIFEVIMRNQLKIKATNTQDPTLEDAFIAILNQNQRRP